MLIIRALSAVVIVGVTALFVYLGGLPFLAFITAISAAATYEYNGMLRHLGFSPFTWVSVALSIAFVADAYFRFDLWRASVGAAVVLTLIWLIFSGREMSRSVADWSLSFVGALYVGVPMSHFVLLRQMSPGQYWGGLDTGLWWVVLVLVGTWASDTGAYLIGSAFGRRGFMTHISSRKTWEGAIGGTLLCFAVVAPIGIFVLNVAPIPALIFGALLGPVAILGDLAESLLKRGTGVKDSGRLIPGHGGALDRVDSLIFAVVVTYYFALMFGKQ